MSTSAMLGGARVCSSSACNVASASAARERRLRRDPLAAIGDRDPPRSFPRSPARELVDLQSHALARLHSTLRSGIRVGTGLRQG